jgi:hypothetical protein
MIFVRRWTPAEGILGKKRSAASAHLEGGGADASCFFETLHGREAARPDSRGPFASKQNAATLSAADGLRACVAFGGGELLDCLARDWIEAFSSRLQMRENGIAHPRIPEFFDVLGGTGDGLSPPLTFKKRGDLISHVNELVG